MGIPARLIDFLNEEKARYEILHHPEAFTAQELAAIEHVKGRSHAKVVMAKTNEKVFMMVLPADHRVDLEKLSKVTGRPTALAAETEFKELFQSLTDSENIVFEAGTHSDAIKMRFADYQGLAKSQVADFASKLP